MDLPSGGVEYHASGMYDRSVNGDTRKPMKVLGGSLLPPWERFNRLQRSAAVLLRGRLGPKGVFRFKSFEEFDQWKAKHQGHSLEPHSNPT